MVLDVTIAANNIGNSRTTLRWIPGIYRFTVTSSDDISSFAREIELHIATHKASNVSRLDNIDGSRTYTVDLRSLAAGTAVALSFDLIGFATALDLEGTALSALVVAGPQHGSLTVNADGTFSYAPVGNHFGADSIACKVNGGELDSPVVCPELAPQLIGAMQR